MQHRQQGREQQPSDTQFVCMLISLPWSHGPTISRDEFKWLPSKTSVLLILVCHGANSFEKSRHNLYGTKLSIRFANTCICRAVHSPWGRGWSRVSPLSGSSVKVNGQQKSQGVARFPQNSRIPYSLFYLASVLFFFLPLLIKCRLLQGLGQSSDSNSKLHPESSP